MKGVEACFLVEVKGILKMAKNVLVHTQQSTEPDTIRFHPGKSRRMNVLILTTLGSGVRSWKKTEKKSR